MQALFLIYSLVTLTGARCSCGQWITPSFQIHKSKIDQCFPPKTLSDKTELIANSNS